MLGYTIKRILYFIPTLLVISLIAFALSKMTPGDPLYQLCPPPDEENSSFEELTRTERELKRCARMLGVDKPSFYFSIKPAAYPDTLYRIVREERRKTLKNLVGQYGNWNIIQTYYSQLTITESNLFETDLFVAKNALIDLKRSLGQLYINHRDAAIRNHLENINGALADLGAIDSLEEKRALIALKNEFEKLNAAYIRVKEEAKPGLLYIPSFAWYGFNNQYHNWLINFFTGDFGISYVDKRPAFKKIKEAASKTLLINLIALILIYGLSIPIGVWSAVRKDKTFDRILTILLFGLYSLPAFWIATLCIVFLTTPEYGKWLDWFPSGGWSGLTPGGAFWDRFWDVAYHLILPVACLTYPALAFVSRQMRGGMLDALNQDFVRTARAKGLPESKVIWKHAFRNALFPLITLVANIFPAILAGSVIIEYIFNIPGMGRLTYDSIFNEDWQVLYAILMLAAVLTMVGILVADILYAKADPRVSFKIKR